MKPDGGVEETVMEAAELEPSEFFLELGMLVLESRLPAASVKGRQDGPHCPPAVGDRSGHICDVRLPQCKKASEMQKQIQTLWRNHIPMCIEVLLFPDCVHGQQKATSTDAVLPVTGDGCVLLEQWTIQLIVKKSAETCISSKALFQAMRSYLHFSQLSAWLNLTHGVEPRHIGYRVSPPAEFCTTTFTKTPESHLFPLAAVNKSTNIKVALARLPRLPEIPKPICLERVGKQPCAGHDLFLAKLSEGGDGLKAGLQFARSDSPKLDKPNVLHALSAEECEMLTRAPKCCCADCARSCATNEPEMKTGSVFPKTSPDLLDGLSWKKSATSAAGQPETVRPYARDSGAIPKRFSLQLKSVPEDFLAKHPLTPQQTKSFHMTNDEGTNISRLDLKLASHSTGTSAGPFSPNLPSYINCCKNLIPEVLPSSCLLKDCTDSCGSSPDYDLFLSKTLAKQSEPLTLDEMEHYLQSLYQPNIESFRDAGFTSTIPFSSKSKKPPPQQHLHLMNKPNSSARNRDSNVGELTNALEVSVSEKRTSVPGCCAKRLDFEQTPGDVIPSQRSNFLDSRTQSGRLKGQKDDDNLDHSDDAMENHEKVGSTPELKGLLRTSAACNKGSDFRPVFTVGDVGEIDEKGVAKDSAVLESFYETFLDLGEAADKTKLPADDMARREYLQNGPPSSAHAIHKSISCPSQPAFKNNGVPGFMGFNKANSLFKTVMKKEMIGQLIPSTEANIHALGPNVPTSQERMNFRRSVQTSASMVFHAGTGLPLQSSPVPAKKISSGSFDYDSSLDSVRAIKNSLSCMNLNSQDDDNSHLDRVRQTYSTSAPASTNCLLGSFEESLINGRIEPSGVVDGFTVDIGASGSFYPAHITLPVTAFFFTLSDDNAPSPYLGHINLESFSKRGYHIPKQGTIQVTLFNPNTTVVKMFVVKYDLSDMPSSHQTVLRQRTLYMPVKGSPSDLPGAMVYLRYLIHLRFASSKSSKIYLHTDIRVIFARDKFELDSRVANYELRSFTEGPENPKFSPRK